jgi:hypothetical protein
MLNNDEREKGYINFLESVLEASNSDLQITQSDFDFHGPEEGIVKWSGDGDLPTELSDSEMNDLVKRITSPGEHLGGQQDEGGIKEEDPKAVIEGEEMEESPLSILEELRRLEEDDEDIPEDIDDDLLEDIDFTDQEGEIISRLIGEMDSLEDDGDLDIITDDVDSYETMDGMEDGFDREDIGDYDGGLEDLTGEDEDELDDAEDDDDDDLL